MGQHARVCLPRRASPRISTLLAWAALGLVLWGCGPRRYPNVILLVVDPLRADHLGCYGYARSTSPRIDEWAESGMRFTRAYSASSWTAPSVVSILTALYPAAHGVELGTAVLSDDVPTLAQAFHDAGYRT